MSLFKKLFSCLLRPFVPFGPRHQVILAGLLLALPNLLALKILLLPLLMLAFSLLFKNVSLLPHATVRQRFKTSWLFALGYYAVSLYWIPNALFVHIEDYFWLIPFAFLVIPSLSALSFALSSALIPWMRFQGFARVLGFMAAWLIAKKLLEYPFNGFPWSHLGYMWHTWPAVSQLAFLTGIHGLSALTILYGTLFYLLTQKKSWRLRFLLLLSALLALLALDYAGTHRIKKGEATALEGLPALRVVQPNIPQEMKWKHQYQHQNLRKLLNLTYGPGYETKAVFIWPEAALTFTPTPEVFHVITRALNPGQYLLTGTISMTARSGSTSADPLMDLQNVLIALNDQGEKAAVYAKSHLVPFGEYIPLKDTLESFLPFKLEVLTKMPYDTVPGKGLTTLKLPGVPPFGPLICYEVIFSGKVALKGEKRPHWLLNITNDGWFGDSAGPRQHLVISRFRAIEENMPLVRAAGTGISAIIDRFGRVHQQAAYNTAGVLDYEPPK